LISNIVESLLESGRQRPPSASNTVFWLRLAIALSMSRLYFQALSPVGARTIVALPLRPMYLTS